MKSKIDVNKNGDVSQAKEPSGRTYPIRVSPTTVFYVTKEKNTPEYAEKLRERYNKKIGKSYVKTDNSNSPLD